MLGNRGGIVPKIAQGMYVYCSGPGYRVALCACTCLASVHVLFKIACSALQLPLSLTQEH